MFSFKESMTSYIAICLCDSTKPSQPHCSQLTLLFVSNVAESPPSIGTVVCAATQRPDVGWIPHPLHVASPHSSSLIPHPTQSRRAHQATTTQGRFLVDTTPPPRSGHAESQSPPPCSEGSSSTPAHHHAVKVHRPCSAVVGRCTPPCSASLRLPPLPLFVALQCDQQCAIFFYTSTIPFNVIKNPEFLKFCEMVGRYGIGYKPPCYHELRET
ncbi:hypothetical protein S83_071512 [Arachis hypogaea]